MHQNCPICFEFLFESVDPTTVLRCGHTIHTQCVRVSGAAAAEGQRPGRLPGTFSRWSAAQRAVPQSIWGTRLRQCVAGPPWEGSVWAGGIGWPHPALLLGGAGCHCRLTPPLVACLCLLHSWHSWKWLSTRHPDPPPCHPGLTHAPAPAPPPRRSWRPTRTPCAPPAPSARRAWATTRATGPSWTARQASRGRPHDTRHATVAPPLRISDLLQERRCQSASATRNDRAVLRCQPILLHRHTLPLPPPCTNTRRCGRCQCRQSTRAGAPTSSAMTARELVWGC